MAKRLTTKFIENIKPLPERKEYPDGGSSMYLIVQPSARCSFAGRARFEGETIKLTLNSYPTPPVAAQFLPKARKDWAAAQHELAHGRDPRAAKFAAKAAATAATTERARDTIERLAELYLEQHARRKTREATWKQAESIFRREVLPQWRKRPAADISRKDIRELLRAIVATRPILANRCHAHLSTYFKWLVNEDYITGSPMVGIEQPAKENVRDRALSDAEIRRFWAATDKLPAPLGSAYRLLLLSGARRQEVAEMQWRELDLAQKTWTLPAKRSKSRVSHVLPLGELAWRIIEAQPHISDYVFGGRRSGFSHFKPALDAEMQPDEPWVNHDLRRTARSLMSRAHVESEVAERMIGHLPRGIIKTYNVYDFLREKREGFAKLEREIDLIVNPLAVSVIPLRR